MKLTFGKYKGREEETVPASYLEWARLNVSFYKPTPETLKRIEEWKYEQRQIKYRNRHCKSDYRHWDNCSTLELMIYAA